MLFRAAVEGCVTVLVWRDGGRLNGFLNAGPLFVVVRGAWILLGMVRLMLDIEDARLELVLAEADVAGVEERAREVREGCFCSEGFVCGGFETADMAGFLRSCSVDDGGRICD